MSFVLYIKERKYIQKSVRFDNPTITKINEALAVLSNGKGDLTDFVNSANKFLLNELEKFTETNQSIEYFKIKQNVLNFFDTGKTTPKNDSSSINVPNSDLERINKILDNIKGEKFSDFARVAVLFSLVDLISNKIITDSEQKE